MKINVASNFSTLGFFPLNESPLLSPPLHIACNVVLLNGCVVIWLYPIAREHIRNRGRFPFDQKFRFEFRNVRTTSRGIPKFPKLFSRISGIFGRNGKRPVFDKLVWPRWRKIFFVYSGSSDLGSNAVPGHCVVFLGKTLCSHSAFLQPGV